MSKAIKSIFRWVGQGSSGEERAVQIVYGHGFCEEPYVKFISNGVYHGAYLSDVEKAIARPGEERDRLQKGLQAIPNWTG